MLKFICSVYILFFIACSTTETNIEKTEKSSISEKNNIEKTEKSSISEKNKIATTQTLQTSQTSQTSKNKSSELQGDKSFPKKAPIKTEESVKSEKDNFLLKKKKNLNEANSAKGLMCCIGLTDGSFLNGKGIVLLKPESVSNDKASKFVLGIIPNDYTKDTVFTLVYLPSENNYITVNELRAEGEMLGTLSMAGESGMFSNLKPSQTLFTLEDAKSSKPIISFKDLIFAEGDEPIAVYCKTLYGNGYLHDVSEDSKRYLKFRHSDKSSALKLLIYFQDWVHN
jgi:hypothetical protein